MERKKVLPRLIHRGTLECGTLDMSYQILELLQYVLMHWHRSVLGLFHDPYRSRCVLASWAGSPTTTRMPVQDCAALPLALHQTVNTLFNIQPALEHGTLHADGRAQLGSSAKKRS